MSDEPEPQGIYPSWEPVPAPVRKPFCSKSERGFERPGLGRFLRHFGKSLVVLSFWGVSCIGLIATFIPHAAPFNIFSLLLLGLATTGLIVCIGLPIKWYREYKLASGHIHTGNN